MGGRVNKTYRKYMLTPNQPLLGFADNDPGLANAIVEEKERIRAQRVREFNSVVRKLHRERRSLESGRWIAPFIRVTNDLQWWNIPVVDRPVLTIHPTDIGVWFEGQIWRSGWGVQISEFADDQVSDGLRARLRSDAERGEWLMAVIREFEGDRLFYTYCRGPLTKHGRKMEAQRDREATKAISYVEKVLKPKAPRSKKPRKAPAVPVADPVVDVQAAGSTTTPIAMPMPDFLADEGGGGGDADEVGYPDEFVPGQVNPDVGGFSLPPDESPAPPAPECVFGPLPRFDAADFELKETDLWAAIACRQIAEMKPVKTLFRLHGVLYVCAGGGNHEFSLYKLTALEEWDGPTFLYSEKERGTPATFYHGIKITHRKQTYVLNDRANAIVLFCGPENAASPLTEDAHEPD